MDVRILEVWAMFRVKILETFPPKNRQDRNSVYFTDFVKQHRVDCCNRKLHLSQQSKVQKHISVALVVEMCLGSVVPNLENSLFNRLGFIVGFFWGEFIFYWFF